MWAIPATIIATSAPAIAASNPANCVVLPGALAEWEIGRVHVNGAGVSIGAGSDGNRFLQVVADTDNDAATDTTRGAVTLTTAMDVTEGELYRVDLLLQAAKGYNGTGQCATVGSRLEVSVVQGSDTTALARATTTAGDGGRMEVIPPVNCTEDGSRQSQYGAHGAVGDSVPLSVTFQATITGTATMRLTFDMGPTSDGNNDDWRVTLVGDCA